VIRAGDDPSSDIAALTRTIPMASPPFEVEVAD
jgi:hypothetical protein